MNIEELESVVDAMAEECGDQIDALYDTVTLNKDTYNGFICRLREVVRLAKNEQEKSAPDGNAAAMREAAVTVYGVLEKIRPFALHLGDVGHMREFNHLICLAKNRLDAALAAPPRNCDVGSPEEQAERYASHCNMFPQCAGCPCCGKVSYGKCEFVWAQIPYEEGGK